MRERPVVFLHIGAAKTGTTYLQSVLFSNRAALRREGLLYPGAARSHFWAAQDLRDMPFKNYLEPQVPGAWPRLVAEIRGWHGRALIDHEILAGANRRQIDRALADLDFADVHLVWTARDIARQLPAAWQERIKNRETITFARFLAAAHEGLTPGHPARVFWPLQDGPRILARWSRNLPPERVHVVTVPPSGAEPGLLWRRFASLLGVQPERYDTGPASPNVSLGAAEVAVLRSLNESIATADISWPFYRATIKHGVARNLGAQSGTRIGLPEDVYAWALEWTHDAIAQLRNAGYDVVGDLDELVPTVPPTGDDPDNPPADARADAAQRMLTLLMREFAARHDAASRSGRQRAKATVRRIGYRIARTGLVPRRGFGRLLAK